MKKIIVFLTISVLLVSCGKKDEAPITSSDNEVTTQQTTDSDTSVIDNTPTGETGDIEEPIEEDSKDSKDSETWEKESENDTSASEIEASSPPTNDFNASNPELETPNTDESTEELVEDFGDELESLFDLIEASE